MIAMRIEPEYLTFFVFSFLQNIQKLLCKINILLSYYSILCKKFIGLQ